MEDKELLELAAKAAGIAGDMKETADGAIWLFTGDHKGPWNPLTDDGDALRLAVKLGLQVTPYPIYAEPKHSVLARKCRLGKEDNGIGEPDTENIEWLELYDRDPSAATRRAIVRAAAEIGRNMK